MRFQSRVTAPGVSPTLAETRGFMEVHCETKHAFRQIFPSPGGTAVSLALLRNVFG